MKKYKIDKKSLALALMLVLAIVISLLFVDFNIFEDSNKLYGKTQDVAGQSILGINPYNSIQNVDSKCENYAYLEYLPPLPRSDFSENSFNKFLANIQPYEQYIKEACAHYQIPEELMKSIMRIESGGRIYHTKTVTIKDGQNSKIKVKTLCNGRCGICKFAGGPGNSNNCMEDQKKCNYYDNDGKKWTISSSTGYCSITQTSIAGCEKIDTCNVNEFLNGNPKDAIYNGVAHVRSKLNAYIKFVSTPPYNQIPGHNLYWAVAFAYNNGQGSMRVALKEFTKLKYNGDYSKFNWWEIIPEDFIVTKSSFASSIQKKINSANGKGRTSYPLTVLKAMKMQGFDGCNSDVIIGEKAFSQYTGTQQSTSQTQPTNLAQIELKDKFIYQIDPSFYVPLTHELNIYTVLREKAFLIAKEIEKCHEQKNVNIDGTKISTINKTIIKNCVEQEINKNKIIAIPYKLNLEICDKDINKASYAICAKSNNNISVFTGTRISEKELTYKFALGFGKPSLKNINIKTVQNIKEEIKEIPGTITSIHQDAISFSQKKHNSKEVNMITLDINQFDIKVMSASSILGKQKASLKDMIEATGAVAGITGGFFNVNKKINDEICSRPENSGEPLGLVIENSKKISEMFNMDWDCHLMQKGVIDPSHIFVSNNNENSNNVIIKSRDEYLQTYTTNNPEYALQSGALIYNGKEQKCPFDESGFCSPSLKRSTICITNDNKLKLITFKSLSLNNLPSWIKEECKSFLNLDGGGSTSMEYNVNDEFHSIQLEHNKEHHFTEPTTIDDGRNIVNAILIFPKVITQQQQTNIPSSERKIGAFGDSITVGGGKSWGYVKKLEQRSVGKAEVFAKSGASSSYIKSLLIKTLETKQFHDIIILAGVNNIKNNKNGVIADLQEMYSYAKSKGSRVIAMTITPYKGYRTWEQDAQDDIIAVNNWIKFEAKEVDVVVDIYSAVVDPNDPEKMKDSVTSDGIHPNGEGHILMAEAIYETAYKNLELINSEQQTTTTQLTIPAQLTQITEKIPEDIKFYTYTTKCTSSVPNENNRVEAIIIPEGISSTPDIYFYFHGMHSYSNYNSLLVDYNCLSKGICNNMKKIKENGEDAIMVMFSGSKDSSNYGQWMKDNFKCFYDESISTINSMNLQPQNMQLMGHSGGGKAIKNIVETFIEKEEHIPLKATVFYDACYTWCNAIKGILKKQGAKLYSSVTLISGGNVLPRKSDFKALTGINIDSATPNIVYPGINNDQEIKVAYMKELNHGVIPKQCFYNFLNDGQCIS
jgi:lysophospholipase L1-like esterase